MRWFILLVFIFFVDKSIAQQMEGLLNTRVNFVREVNLAELKKNQLFISMPFAKEVVLNPEQKKVMEERVVVKVELVYTKYRKVVQFNQKELNRKRLLGLQKLLPQLFENPFWDFQLVSQTKGNSTEECDQMFHGFILTFRPNSTKETLAKEADYIENLVSKLTDDLAKKDLTQKTYKIKTRWDNRYVYDTIWTDKKVVPVTPPDFFYNPSLYNDSTVLRAFDRNSNWDNMMIVTDVTGSMSPYIAQVFVWLRQQVENKKAQYFVFFNDGDDKLSRRKEPLKTGGVYMIKNEGIDVVKNEVVLCMRKGDGGGEHLENDVEAIIEGIDKYKDAGDIVLIADNKESMRDYKFIGEIKKPVHVILCGAEHRINIQYLDLARKTGGSLHTLKTDITGLDKVQLGQIIIVEGKKYLYQKGRFHHIYSGQQDFSILPPITF